MVLELGFEFSLPSSSITFLQPFHFIIYVIVSTRVGQQYFPLFYSGSTFTMMAMCKVCPCGDALSEGDNHVKCMLCLGNHDMSSFPVCQAMSTPAKALRRRAYNDAVNSGFLMVGARRHIFPPLPSTGVAVPTQVHPGEVLDRTERHVGSYFHALQDREDDDMTEQDDIESGKHHENVDKVPAAIISVERLTELRQMFGMSQSELDILARDEVFKMPLQRTRTFLSRFQKHQNM